MTRQYRIGPISRVTVTDRAVTVKGLFTTKVIPVRSIADVYCPKVPRNVRLTDTGGGRIMLGRIRLLPSTNASISEAIIDVMAP